MHYLRSNMFQTLTHRWFNWVIAILWMASSASAQTDLFEWPENEFLQAEQDISVQQLERALSESLALEVQLKLDTAISSQIATHYAYQAMHQDVPVYGITVKLNRFLNGKTTVISPRNLTPISKERTLTWNPNTLTKWMTENSVLKTKTQVTKHYFPERNKLLPGWVIEYKKDEMEWESLVSSDGETIFSTPTAFYNEEDTIGRAKVFLPDPITQAEALYENPYIDNNDANSEALNQWLTEVDIPLTWDSLLSRWVLKSEACVIEDVSAPFVPVPNSFSGEFFFERGDPGFEAVNAYYHINEMQTYLQSLGFTNLVNYSISVDPNGLNDSDQSVFYTSGPRIEFGRGGVDDAEDADVIVHEYGHAISHSCAPGTNVGGQRQAIDEGFGDYLAVSYSLQFSDYKAYEVFNWDGHNEYWSGRFADVQRTYPSELTDNIYGDGEMWASSLMEIQEKLGRTATDQILFNSMYSYVRNMDLQAAALLFMQADSALNDGVNSEAIRLVFCARGFLPGCEDTLGVNPLITGPFIANTENFATKGEAIAIYSNNYTLQFYEVFTLNGTLIATDELDPTDRIAEIQLPDLKNGLYVLRIETNSGPFQFRIFRLGS